MGSKSTQLFNSVYLLVHLQSCWGVSESLDHVWMYPEDYPDLPLVNDSWGIFTTSEQDLCQSKPVVVPRRVHEYFQELGSNFGTGFCWNNLSLGDFQGASLLVTLLEYPTIINLVNASDPSSANGLFIDIMDILAVVMNFKIIYVFPDDRKWGNVGQDGLWTGMVGDVLYGRADIAIGGLTINEERSNVVDFTQPISTDDINFNMKRPSGRAMNIHAYMTIFSIDTWLSILGIGIVSGAVIFCTNWRIQTRWGIVDSIEVFSHLFILQGSNLDGKRTLSIQMTLFVTSMFAFLIMTFYTADLTSRMTANEVPRTVSSFQDILDLDLQLFVWPGTATFDFMANSRDGSPQQKIHQRMLASNYDQIEHSHASYRKLLASNPKFVQLGSSNAYSSVTDIISVKANGTWSDHLGFAVPKNWPHLEKLNAQIQRIRESGVMDKLNEKWFMTRRKSWQTPVNVAFPLGYNNTLYPFLILAASCLIAIKLMLIEKCTISMPCRSNTN